MSNKLDNEARYRVVAGLGPLEPGQCEHWVRETVQAVYGDRYEDLMHTASPDGSVSAVTVARAWLRHPPAGVVVIETSDPAQTQVGDLLYKRRGSGGFGHVGIRVVGNKVAENSSTRSGRVHGALGFRYLLRGEAPSAAAWFGAFDLVVRLPA